jgi:DNA-binding SARP family transcriptional activator
MIDELWGKDPPARARDSLQVHVSRLRKALTEQAPAEAGWSVSQSGGYCAARAGTYWPEMENEAVGA